MNKNNFLKCIIFLINWKYIKIIFFIFLILTNQDNWKIIRKTFENWVKQGMRTSQWDSITTGSIFGCDNFSLMKFVLEANMTHLQVVKFGQNQRMWLFFSFIQLVNLFSLAVKTALVNTCTESDRYKSTSLPLKFQTCQYSLISSAPDNLSSVPRKSIKYPHPISMEFTLHPLFLLLSLL